jgi:hypothetical protein
MKKGSGSANSGMQVISQLLNFFWTILCFLPVIWYWAIPAPGVWLYGSAAFSIVCGFLPQAFFRSLQLGRSAGFYEKYGVKIIRKFVQQGDLMNRLSRQHFPGYRVIRNAGQAKNYLSTIAMYERYHFMCFLFFLCTTVHGLFAHRFLFALIVTAANFIYNICPVFLQQYNRLRIQRLSKARQALMG